MPREPDQGFHQSQFSDGGDQVSQYQNVSILNFIGAKDDGRGGDNWSCMTCKATLPSRWIQEPSVVRDRDGRPPRGPAGSALLLCV